MSVRPSVKPPRPSEKIILTAPLNLLDHFLDAPCEMESYQNFIREISVKFMRGSDKSFETLIRQSTRRCRIGRVSGVVPTRSISTLGVEGRFRLPPSLWSIPSADELNLSIALRDKRSRSKNHAAVSSFRPQCQLGMNLLTTQRDGLRGTEFYAPQA